MMNSNEAMSICSSNLISYMEKYGYDKNASKKTFSIFKSLIDILKYRIDNKYDFNESIFPIYKIISIFTTTDNVLFKGVDIIDISANSETEVYTLIYNFIYS